MIGTFPAGISSRWRKAGGMENAAYYKQTPIMRRILEYTDGAVSISGTNPLKKDDKFFRRYDDILEAMGDGCDLYRSMLDFKGPLLALDLEYGNSAHPGEIFHKTLETFHKFEPTRLAARNILNEHGIEHVELMTGQGYNYVMRVPRTSPTYKSLLTIGSKLHVLNRSTLDALEQKERQFGNVPLVTDSIVFAAFGRVTDYLVEEIKTRSELLLRTTDLFDSEEIAIFDTTLYGYLFNRRSIRTAFSLHQKTRMKEIYNYDGPAIVAIPVAGVPLEERLKIRQDEREHYRRAVQFADEVRCEIPAANLGSLLVTYMTSPVYDRHLDFSRQLQREDPNRWNLPEWPELEAKMRGAGLDQETLDILAMPNPRLLQPWWLRHVIRSLREHGFSFAEVVGMITTKYNAQFNWHEDLVKSNSALRAEYWTRTLWEV